MESKRKLSPLVVFLAVVMLLTVGSFVQTKTASAATPYKANGRLAVKNGKIVNAKGKAFVIKGVSTHGLAWFPEYVNKKSFQTMRDKWGVNTVRLALYTSEYNGYCSGGNKAQLKKLIDNGVKYANSLGMYVIIDWHILSDGNPLTYKKESLKFFKEIAKKYAKYGNVMYEICNEPNGGGGSWKNIKSYANSVIKTIRSVNKNAIIVVGTPTWSQDVDQAKASPVKGYKNIAYAFHFYAGTHKEQLRNKLETAVKGGLPVIVTEFGICDASGNGGADTAEGNRWIRLLDKYKIGRVCWSLSNKNETASLLKSSCKKTSGWTAADLSASGKWLVKTYTGKAAAGGTSSGSTKKPSTGGTSSSGSSKTANSTGKGKVTATVTKVNSWKNGGKTFTQYKVLIKNSGKGSVSKWQAVVQMKQDFTVSDKWCASFSRSGRKLTIKPLSWNRSLNAGQQTEIGFILKSSGSLQISSVSVSGS